MSLKTLFLIASTFVVVFDFGAYASIGGYIGPSDKKRLLASLTKALTIGDGDITSAYYAAKGFKLFNEKIPAVLVKDNCAELQREYKPVDSTPEVNFQVLAAWSLLGCSGKLHTDATIKNLQSALEGDKSTIADIHYALEALHVLNQPIPSGAKISQLLQAKLREDDSLQSLGHALHAASFLGNAGKFALDRVEEAVVQADEVDGKLLQWEGGLSVTSLLLTGIHRLSGAKPLTQAQAEKFASYLLTRRTVPTPKGVLALIEAAEALAASEVSPVSITVVGPPQVTTQKPELKIHISDILGRPLKSAPSSVVAQSATRISDDVVVLSKQALNAGGSPGEFVLSLRLDPGEYRVALTAGSHSTSLTVKVLGSVSLEWLEIGLSDSDGSSAPRLTKLQHPAKLSSALQADSSQHLIIKFSLTKIVHQSFIRLYTSTNKEIFFVAEPDSNKLYKLDVNLASELAHSGTFHVELILGDFVMSNAIRWVLGDIELTLNTPEALPKTIRGPKPEIRHVFRQPEKRPAEAVSLFFTALTAAPLLILLGLWAKIGINFGNFSTLSIPFHLGFGAILALFTLFWLKLDMFTTCAYLIPIGGFTFLAGQKLLSHIAKQKK